MKKKTEKKGAPASYDSGTVRVRFSNPLVTWLFC
ncbi:hypothetical protein L195_g016624 [Trifolium pratense]|uniref:Uncharacterized protein n=1 Tax=Trifolium pratense TaxID=57577 RepID=A0A2K3MRM6_TRIPR|nr:hypothetical protein L195_g016624 [Trifolium pratense]